MPSADGLFNRPTADIILRSSDGVDFRVHKLILLEASEAFEQIFSLPSSSAEDDLPVLDLAEDSKTLSALLGFYYPGQGGYIQDLDLMGRVIIAAEKYIMPGILRQLELALRDYTSMNPVRVYALACRFGFSSLATIAAREALKHPSPGPPIPELNLISATAYYNLLSYRAKCFEIINKNEITDCFALAENTRAIPTFYSPSADSLGFCSTCKEKWWEHGYGPMLRDAFNSCIVGRTVVAPLFVRSLLNMIQSSCKYCYSSKMGALWEHHLRLEKYLDQEIAKVRIHKHCIFCRDLMQSAIHLVDTLRVQGLNHWLLSYCVSV